MPPQETEDRTSLWHRFTDWFIRDMYTLEERAILREEARRLKLATDLFEERRAARLAKANHETAVAVWRIKFLFRNGPEDTFKKGQALVVLTQSQTHRFVCFDTAYLDTPGAPPERMDRETVSVAKATPAWASYVEPWMRGSITLEQLLTCKDVYPVGADIPRRAEEGEWT